MHLFSPPRLMFFFLICFPLSGMSLIAQDVSDTDITGYGDVRLEVGATHTINDDDGRDTETTSVPTTLFRTGLGDRLESRLEWDGVQWEEEDVDGGADTSEHGSSDPAASIKYLLNDETETMPRMAVLTGTTLPAGDDDFSSERFDPQLLGIASKTLSDAYTIEAHAGIEWATTESASGDRDTLASAVHAVTLYRKLNSSWSVFLEESGSIPLNAGGGPANRVDAGVIHVFTPQLELDVWAGTGVSDDASDVFVSTNLVIRF